MSRKDEEQDKAVPRPGRLAAMLLRAIDACARGLQRLRKRFEVPEEEGASRRDGRRGEPDPEPPAPEVAPRRRGFLFYALIVLVSLLLGAAAGAVSSYRGLSKLIAAREAAVEDIRDELDVAKKEQARSVNLMARFQKENGEFRLQLREAQRQADDYQGRIDELEKQLTATTRVERRAATSAATARTGAPPKTGTCAVSTGNPGRDLTECMDEFNRR